MAKKPAEGIELDVPSAHQRYLESLLGEDKEAPVFYDAVNPADSVLVNDDGYVGTDPIYQNYADETHKPFAAEGGADGLAEEAYEEAVFGDPKEAGDQLQESFGKVRFDTGETQDAAASEDDGEPETPATPEPPK